jgi:predicted dehydrogenase
VGAGGARLRGAVVGCGFFARNHLHAWRDLEPEGARIVAVCDSAPGRAAAVAAEFGVPAAFESLDALLAETRPDFVDLVTPPATHAGLVARVAAAGVPVICQKPLARSRPEAVTMIEACRNAGVPLMVHENFRRQTPLRAVRAALPLIGPPFYARIHWRSGYDVYRDQPYLAEEPRFILMDLGVHLLDLARFLLGEAESLTCRTRRVNPAIRGEDEAVVLLGMRSGATCLVELSYASRPAQDPFPETLVEVEGPAGSLALRPGFRLELTTGAGTRVLPAAPTCPAWGAEGLAHIQESVVATQRDWLECLRTGRPSETGAEDNLRTLDLVFACYESQGRTVTLPEESAP